MQYYAKSHQDRFETPVAADLAERGTGISEAPCIKSRALFQIHAPRPMRAPQHREHAPVLCGTRLLMGFRASASPRSDWRAPPTPLPYLDHSYRAKAVLYQSASIR